MADLALVDGAGYYVSFGDGAWHEVQDTSILAGYGIDIGSAVEYPSMDYVQPVVDVLGPNQSAPAPTPPPTPPPPPPDGTVTSATTFLWGGITWGANDLTAFVNYLAQRGVSFESWAANHPTAAQIIAPTVPIPQYGAPPTGGSAGSTTTTTPPQSGTVTPVEVDYGSQIITPQLTFGTLIEIPSEGDFTLPDYVAGNATAAASWRGIVNYLSGSAVTHVQNAKAAASRFASTVR